MARIFISYAREDQSVVRPMALALEQAGHEVWWDKALTGGDEFRQSIEHQLTSADVEIVVWSKRAKVSRWVLDEAEAGVQKGILLPIRIDDAKLPLGFGGFHALDFRSWGADVTSKAWRELRASVDRIAHAPSPPSSRPAIKIAFKAMLLMLGLGGAVAHAIWALYPLKDRAGVHTGFLGHAVLDFFALASLCMAPVATWSALEVKRAGFQSLGLMFRRSLFWLAISLLLALAALILATAAGAVRETTPGGIIGELAGLGLAAMSAIAMIITSLNILAFLVFRALRGGND